MHYKLFLVSIFLFLISNLLLSGSIIIDAQQNITENENNSHSNSYTPTTSHMQYTSGNHKLFENDVLSEDEVYFLMTFSLLTFFSGLLLLIKNRDPVMQI